MMTVKEVSRRTGVSIRTLQYYDKIGLLKASAYTEAGYRLYDQGALEKLQSSFRGCKQSSPADDGLLGLIYVFLFGFRSRHRLFL